MPTTPAVDEGGTWGWLHRHIGPHGALHHAGGSPGRVPELTDRGAFRTALKEAVVYLLFMVLFTAHTARGITEGDYFYFGNAIREGLTETRFEGHEAALPHNVGRLDADKSFSGIKTVPDLWRWMEGPLAWTAFDGDSGKGAPHAVGSVSSYGTLLGAVRISQLRAAPRNCDAQVPAALRADPSRGETHAWTCYDEDGSSDINFDVGFESKAPFGSFALAPPAPSAANATPSSFGPFLFDGIEGATGVPIRSSSNSSASSSSSSSRATVAEHRAVFLSTFTTRDWNVYPAPAFAVTLAPTLSVSAARRVINGLRDSGYITLSTRAVFVDFSVYNPMLDRICWTRVSAEATRSGGLVMTHEMETVQLWANHGDRDRVYVGVFYAICLFYAYFLLVELSQWHALGGRAYWGEWLNVFQMLNVFLFACQLWARHLTSALAPGPTIAAASPAFYELNPAVRAHKAGVATMAVNVFLNWFKLIAYLSLNPTFAMMANTISRCAKRCGAFCALFFFILYGFSQAHAMVFQGRVYAFRTLGQVLTSAFSVFYLLTTHSSTRFPLAPLLACTRSARCGRRRSRCCARCSATLTSSRCGAPTYTWGRCSSSGSCPSPCSSCSTCSSPSSRTPTTTPSRSSRTRRR